MSAATHWAAPLIGIPWSRGATGPHQYDCWNLVRHVQRTHYGIEMPVLAIGHATNWTGIRAIINTTAWGRVEMPAEGDLVTMKGAYGPHVGVVIADDGGLTVLHCIGNEKNSGGVITTPLSDLADLGFGRVEIWRLRK